MVVVVDRDSHLRLLITPSANPRATAGAMCGNPWQRPGFAWWPSSHEIIQAIRNLPAPLLPQLAWRCPGVERVMGTLHGIQPGDG